MRLTILGSAGSAPGPDSPCSGYLVEHDDFKLLLDLGPGASMTLQRFVSPGDIDAAILSHRHSDHHADLTQMWRLRMVTDSGPFALIGPSDLSETFTNTPEMFDFTSATDFAATDLIHATDFAPATDVAATDVAAAARGAGRLGPLDVRLSQVVHGETECWATRIGDALCYTADTEPCAALDELADGAGVLLAEGCGSDDDGPMPGHLTAGDAARLSVRSGAKLLVLTHLRAWNDNAKLLAEAAAIATCPVILAIPGLRIACNA